ncbi:toxic anion resistance protein [Salicibibacter cibi]|uniref:Toxic anion resistance protein n=1 Tax=Salicibibacter cibi TaxID=2743001 RepID=A0A7T7CFC4_9BACI|nr:toxic anion resistance protein [Salicibibacter cibi]QQK79953.1 toxic anion resistance protein [Salicibibacter cibi]
MSEEKNQENEEIETQLPEEAQSKAEEAAKGYMEKFKESDDASSLVNELGGLGEHEQKQAGESLEALKRPVGEMLEQKNNELPDRLYDLRQKVASLEPDHLKESRLQKTLNKLIRRDPVEQYAKKYKTVEGQVENIIESLLAGKDKLQADNLMLDQLRETANERIQNLEQQIETGKQLNEMLEAEMTAEEWRDNPVSLQKGQQKVVTRIQNMSQAIMVLQQSLASVDLIKENNEKLEEAIFNAITMTKNVITVTASIQLALGNQKNVIDAVQNVNQATEDMILSNAKTLRSNTEETLKTLEEPAVAIESFREAYEDVQAAIDITEQSNERIVKSGKAFIAELEKLNEDVRKKLPE